MHPGERVIDASLVRRLVATQFPQWAGLPVERVPSAGTVNAVYRLGDGMAVRLPRVEWGVGDVARERRWLPFLAPRLPVEIPVVLGEGRPGEGYPWPWSVYRWLDGDTPETGGVPDLARFADPVRFASDLAGFIGALRRVETDGAPPAYRGGPLTELDAAVRDALGRLGGIIDTGAAAAAWRAALKAPEWSGPPVWVHSDLMPANLLVRDGRLSGVIDFATAGVGDPSCDLTVAWNLLPAKARQVFRAAVGADDASWARGRGRALAIALVQLPYYRETNPVLAANARHTIEQVLTDRG